MKKFAGVLLSLTLAAVTLAGCGSAATTPKAEAPKAEAPKAEAPKAEAPKKQRNLTAGGSSALLPLVEQAAKLYQEKTGNVVTAQAGGSGTGLSQVSAGAFDIGNSDIFAEEKSGIDATKLVDTKVAVVGMGPVANPKVGVKGITKAQMIDIFTGKIKNWKEVGGADQAIVVINRAKGSGTRATFEVYGLDKAQVIEAQEQDNSGTVRQMVAQTPGAISYLAFSYFNNEITALEVDKVAPTDANVTTGTWKIWAYEHMYTLGAPDESEKAFLDFMMSADVQNEMVKKLGYIPGKDMKVERPFQK